MLRTTQPNLDYIKQEQASSSPCGGVSPGIISPGAVGGVGGASPAMTYHHHDAIDEVMMEDHSATQTLLNDPMISLASPVVEQHSRRSSGAVSMEEAAEMLG